MTVLTKYFVEPVDAYYAPVCQFMWHNWPSLCAGAVICKVSLFYHKRSKYPPGPYPYPFIGNLLALASFGGSFYRAAEVWRQQYGDIFTVWIGEKPWIFVNSLQAIQQCNGIDHQHQFAGRVRTNTGDVQMQGNVGLIFSDSGAPQQTLRHIAQQAVRRYLTGRGGRHQFISDIVENFLESHRNQYMEAKFIAEEIVQSISTLTMFGITLDEGTQEELRAAHRDLERNCPSGLPSDVMPILGWLLWWRERAGMAAFLRYNRIVRKLCTQAAANFIEGEANDIRCMADAVLRSALEAPANTARFSAEALNEGNVLQIVFDLFEAGSQTTVITLNWALLKLACDIQLQAELHREIDDLGFYPTRRDKRTLPLLQSFIREVLRFWPAAPFGLPRKLSGDFRLGNYLLPDGSTILFNLYHANRDPSAWEDGYTFNARRFLNEEGNLQDILPHRFMTFGVGARNCVGTQLAIDNLFLVMARILLKYKIEAKETGITLTPSPAALMLDATIQDIRMVPRH